MDSKKEIRLTPSMIQLIINTKFERINRFSEKISEELREIDRLKQELWELKKLNERPKQ